MEKYLIRAVLNLENITNVCKVFSVHLSFDHPSGQTVSAVAETWTPEEADTNVWR